jgi:hypothetical protein
VSAADFNWATVAMAGLAGYGAISAVQSLAALVRLRREVRASGKPAPHRAAEAPPPTFSPWRALLGNRIALRDTGFEIEMRLADPSGRTYWLWSPEGLPVAAAGPATLQSLKSMAEQMALERKEFEARAELWKP